MEKIERIREEIKNANARIREREQENEKRAAELVKAWMREGDKFKKRDITPAEQENNERLERAMASAEQENKRDKIRAEILRENLKSAAFETVKPYIFGLLEKYEGKAYGENTRDKIAQEAREACGFYIYYGEEYGSAKIRIYEAGSYNNGDANITITAQSLDIFGGELKNRLRAPLESEKAAFRIAYERARYTEPEQIDARIDEIITAQEEARRAQEAYNAAIDKYNAVIAGKMESLKREYQRIGE